MGKRPVFIEMGVLRGGHDALAEFFTALFHFAAQKGLIQRG